MLAASSNIGSSQTPPSSYLSLTHPHIKPRVSDFRPSRACHSKIRRQACFADPAAPPLVLPHHRLLVFLASPSGLRVALVEEVAFVVATLELDQAFEAHADRSLFCLEALAPIVYLFSKSWNLAWGRRPSKQVLSRLLASFVEAIGRNRCGLVHLPLMTRAGGNV
jgi:hypothetical protein